MIGVGLETQNHNVALESNYYDKHVVMRDKVQWKCSVAPLDFYGIYDPCKFCDWISHLVYYFDLYELSDRVESDLLRVFKLLDYCRMTR